MILQYFKKKENKDKKIANKLYHEIIETNKLIIKNKKHYLKNDFNSVFEITTFLLFFIFYMLKKEKLLKNIKQELMNIFISDLDHSFKLKGISDIKIGKYVKFYVKKFYFRIKELDKIMLDLDIHKLSIYLEKLDIFVSTDIKDHHILITFLNKKLTYLRDNSQKYDNIREISFLEIFN